MTDTRPTQTLEAPRGGRKRRTETERAILDAARDLLAEGGVPSLTMDAVAVRAGVAKTTIYRRFRDKEDLALAVVVEMVENVVHTPDLGDTRSELVSFVSATIRALRSTPMGRIIQGLVSDLATDSRLADGFTKRVVQVRFEEVARLLERGIARGEIRAGVDARLVHELLFGAVYYRLLFEEGRLDARVAGRIVDNVLVGIAPRTAAG